MATRNRKNTGSGFLGSEIVQLREKTIGPEDSLLLSHHGISSRSQQRDVLRVHAYFGQLRIGFRGRAEGEAVGEAGGVQTSDHSCEILLQRSSIRSAKHINHSDGEKWHFPLLPERPRDKKTAVIYRQVHRMLGLVARFPLWGYEACGGGLNSCCCKYTHVGSTKPDCNKQAVEKTPVNNVKHWTCLVRADVYRHEKRGGIRDFLGNTALAQMEKFRVR